MGAVNVKQSETSADPLAVKARAAAAGDLAAMRELLEALAPALRRVVRGILGAAHADVDDALQESLIALVRALPAFRGDSRVQSYAARITVRTALASRRRGRLRDQRHERFHREVSDPAEPVATPRQHVAADQRRHVLHQLLDELPEAQAETMALRFVLGCSLAEVAEATSAPLNTVRSRLRLAKEALRRRIEQEPSLVEKLEVAL